MSTDAFEQLIDVAAPGGGSYPVQRGHRRGVRSPHTFDAARWPPSSLTSPYAPQGSTTAVLGNVLLAGERYPLERYGVDPIFFWPRLYPLLPEQFQRDYEEFVTEYEFPLVVSTLAFGTALV